MTEDVVDNVFDRMQGGPRKRLEKLATQVGLELHVLLPRLRDFLDKGTLVDWPSGWGFHYVEDTYEGGLQRFWADYELTTGDVVAPDMRGEEPFDCCC